MGPGRQTKQNWMLLYIHCLLGSGRWGIDKLGSIMQTKYLCVLIHIWFKGGVGAVGRFWALHWNILLTVPRRCFFCGSLCFFSVLCLLCLCARLFKCALWSPAWKRLTSWFSFRLCFPMALCTNTGHETYSSLFQSRHKKLHTVFKNSYMIVIIPPLTALAKCKVYLDV